MSVCFLAGPVEKRPTVHRKNVPPPKPPPYIHQRPQSEAITKPSSLSLHGQKLQSESMVNAQSPYWYRPLFSREEAISFVRSLDPGSFVVRDSMSVPGGYAIAIKISQDQVRQRRKMAKGTHNRDMVKVVKLRSALNSVSDILFPFAAAPVTEDMLVTHFLILPDPEGVKLQGWSERTFSEAKTYTVDCKLVNRLPIVV